MMALLPFYGTAALAENNVLVAACADKEDTARIAGWMARQDDDFVRLQIQLRSPDCELRVVDISVLRFETRYRREGEFEIRVYQLKDTWSGVVRVKFTPDDRGASI